MPVKSDKHSATAGPSKTVKSLTEKEENDFLPHDKGTWQTCARKIRVLPTTRLRNARFTSASRFQFPSYLKLRILHNVRPKEELRTTLLQPSHSIEERTQNQSKKHASKTIQVGEPRLLQVEHILDGCSALTIALEHLKKTQARHWHPGHVADVSWFANTLERLYLIRRTKFQDRFINKIDVGGADATWAPEKTVSGELEYQKDASRSPTRKGGSISDDSDGIADNFDELKIEGPNPKDREDRSQQSAFLMRRNDNTGDEGDQHVGKNNNDGESEDEEERKERISQFITGDEEIVNICLMNLLDALSWALGKVCCIHPDRKAFRLRPTRMKKGHLYEARVDGLVTVDDDKSRIKALLECKAALRSANTLDVVMQEGAQIAALIQQGEFQGVMDEKNTGKIWTISLGGYEVTVTLSTYNPQYCDFLNGGEVKGAPFLERFEYESFNLTNKRDMLELLTCVGTIIEGEEHILLPEKPAKP